MTVAFETNILNQAANGLTGANPTLTVGYAQLHTGAPGGAGTANVATSPTGRENLEWSAPSAGEVTLSSPAAFDVDSETITHITLWTASTGGTFLGTITLDPARAFSGVGTLTLTTDFGLGFENAP